MGTLSANYIPCGSVTHWHYPQRAGTNVTYTSLKQETWTLVFCKRNFNLLKSILRILKMLPMLCVCEVQGGFLFGGYCSSYFGEKKKKVILVIWGKAATASVWPVRIRELWLSSTLLKCGTFQQLQVSDPQFHYLQKGDICSVYLTM